MQENNKPTSSQPSLKETYVIINIARDWYIYSFNRLSKIQNSVPEFIQSVKEKSEQNRRADLIRFQVLQDCVSRLAANIESEIKKRNSMFAELQHRLDDAFATALAEASEDHNRRSAEMELICASLSQRLEKNGIFCSFYFSFLYIYIYLCINLCPSVISRSFVH